MSDHEAIIVADLGFGDAGKGTVVDYLAREAGSATVVRFNGGAQAAHNVVTPDGRHHTFSQFGSGTFVPHVRTHLSRYMLFDPIELAAEASHLALVGVSNPLMRLSIDHAALVVTPFHKAANRLRERLRGAGEHGTCGMGIGETMADSLQADDSVRAIDLRSSATVTEKFASIQARKRLEFASVLSDDLKRAQPEEVAMLFDERFPAHIAEQIIDFAGRLQIVSDEALARFAQSGPLLFEGAQGVLLDEWRGFHPHTTWSTTTFENALALLEGIEYPGRVTKLGVLRAYHTRHGAGPLVTHDLDLSRRLPEPHNGERGWQGAFRCGWFDLVMARYAQAVAGADALAITHLDRYAQLEDRRLCNEYLANGECIDTLEVGPHKDLDHQESLTRLLTAAAPVYESAPATEQTFLARIEEELGIPIALTSHGPTALEKQFRM